MIDPRSLNWRRHLLLAIAALAAAPGAGVAQATPKATNPPYLSEMPPVERVMREMQGNDPRATALLQLAAFSQLTEIIKAMAGPREFGKLTPDEDRIIQTYTMAHYHLTQAADSAFPGPYGKWKRFSLNEPYGYMRNDHRFGVEGTGLFQRFFSTAFRAQFDQAIGADQARHQAYVSAHPTESPSPQSAGPQSASPQSFSDMFSGLVQSVGSTFKALGLDVEGPQGLRMAGTYTSPGGAQLSFGLREASISCGGAANDHAVYTVELKNNQIVVTLPAEHPIVLTLRPDGTLASPGSMVMTRTSDNTTQTCPMGILTPPATASAAATAATQPVSAAGNAVLSLAAGVVSPSGALTPVTSRNFLLLNDNLEDVLKQAGFQAEPGRSPLRTMALCQATDPNCKKGMAGISAHGVAAAKTDLNGKATFPGVAAGTYYLVGAAASNNQPIVWNLKVDLRAGANSVVLNSLDAAPSP